MSSRRFQPRYVFQGGSRSGQGNSFCELNRIPHGFPERLRTISSN